MRFGFLTITFLFCSFINAKPMNPEAIQGSFEIENLDSEYCRITVSDDAFIYWDNFSISEEECVEILQPSTHSIVVMEVIKSSPSTILGTLKANGNVFLTNPHGMFIGEDGYVEVSGFLASSLPGCPCPLIDKDYDVFIQGESKALIINQGRIKARNNDVYLIGHKILNHGAVDALQGAVSLASGENIILNRSNGQKVGVVPSPVKEENEETGIENSGMIVAGKVELKSDGNSYGNAILHSGLIDVRGVEEQKAEACLVAENGSSIIHGAIIAENADGTGGKVQVLAENIFLFRNSLIDASGDCKGGEIFIGSGSDGEGEESINAQMTFVDEGVLLHADARESGNGGIAQIWSEEDTFFYGFVSAKGGTISGNGGSIEIIGRSSLDFQGQTDCSSPNGMGTLSLGSEHFHYD